MASQLKVNIPATPAFSYPIKIGVGLLAAPQKWLANIDFNKIVIITDNNVKKQYLHVLTSQLKTLGHVPVSLSFPAGEKYKNQTTKQKLEEKMLSLQLGRDTLCIALGGGVVGDMTGFIAATYMRGIPYIQIPTTLLAMVDSSVGGKTAIDTPQGKNLLGVFWQPKAVIADIHCLSTLPRKQLVNGVIEAMKMFLTSDANSFQHLQKNIDAIFSHDEKALKKLLYNAVSIKAKVVAEDEKETNARMILNFGHTIGHALEKITHYKMLHGYAVGYGILLESNIARMIGLLAPASYIKIVNSLHHLGFYVKDLKKFNITAIIAATRSDKKNKAGQTRYVLLKKIGEIYQKNGIVAHVVDDATVRAAFDHL